MVICPYSEGVDAVEVHQTSVTRQTDATFLCQESSFATVINLTRPKFATKASESLAVAGSKWVYVVGCRYGQRPLDRP